VKGPSRTEIERRLHELERSPEPEPPGPGPTCYMPAPPADRVGLRVPCLRQANGVPRRERCQRGSCFRGWTTGRPAACSDNDDLRDREEPATGAVAGAQDPEELRDLAGRVGAVLVLPARKPKRACPCSRSRYLESRSRRVPLRPGDAAMLRAFLRRGLVHRLLGQAVSRVVLRVVPQSHRRYAPRVNVTPLAPRQSVPWLPTSVVPHRRPISAKSTRMKASCMKSTRI
jgi:hypothetical protein